MSGQKADAACFCRISSEYATARKQKDRIKDLEELVEALTQRVTNLEIVVAYG